jgi:hypothetical protein
MLLSMTDQPPDSVEVPLSSLAELAVDCWRLERWAGSEESASHARHAARRLNKFLAEREVSVVDLTGRPYEPGLAVEVLDVTGSGAAQVVGETVAPVVLGRGRVVRHGQVIVERS